MTIEYKMNLSYSVHCYVKETLGILVDSTNGLLSMAHGRGAQSESCHAYTVTEHPRQSEEPVRDHSIDPLPSPTVGVNTLQT